MLPPGEPRPPLALGEGGVGHGIRPALAHHMVRSRPPQLQRRGEVVRLLPGGAASDADLPRRSHRHPQTRGDTRHRSVPR